MTMTKNVEYTPKKFWFIQKSRTGHQFVIKQVKLLEMLQKLGFARIPINGSDDYLIGKVKNGQVEIVNDIFIADTIQDIINELPADYDGFRYIEDGNENDDLFLFKEDLMEKFLKGMNSFLSIQMLYRLRSKTEIKFIESTPKKGYFFFKNCWCEIDENGVNAKDYKTLDKYVLKSSISKREFTALNNEEIEKSDFYQFIYNIVSGDQERLKAFMTILGYLLHTYQGGKKKAVIFTDSRVGDGEANGRSGKTLLTKMLGWILGDEQFTEINGKNFNLAYAHRYEKCTPNTKIVCLNDVKRGFPVEELFNDVTEKFEINQKNKMTFDIQAKLIINTNLTVAVNGDSAKDRFVEFEFSDYYNVKRSPFTETGRWFGRDWDDFQWNAFYSFMLKCVTFYLKLGLIEAEPINLLRRKLIEETDMAFYHFALDVQSKEPQPNILPNVDYNKKEILDTFLEQYPEFQNSKWFKPRHFTKWCETLCKFHYEGVFEEWTANSNKDRYFKITTIN